MARKQSDRTLSNTESKVINWKYKSPCESRNHARVQIWEMLLQNTRV